MESRIQILSIPNNVHHDDLSQQTDSVECWMSKKPENPPDFLSSHLSTGLSVIWTRTQHLNRSPQLSILQLCSHVSTRLRINPFNVREEPKIGKPYPITLVEIEILTFKVKRREPIELISRNISFSSFRDTNTKLKDNCHVIFSGNVTRLLCSNTSKPTVYIVQNILSEWRDSRLNVV